MGNNKGQALIEFVIILPIFLLILISAVDFGNIISKKYSLENDLDIVSDMYKSKDLNSMYEYTNSKDIDISYKEEHKFIKIVVSKKIKIISPILSKILGNPYKIETSKVMYKNE